MSRSVWTRNRVTAAQNAADERPQLPHPGRGPGRDTAVDDQDGKPPPARRLPQKAGPELGLGQDQAGRVEAAKDAPDAEPEVQGDEEEQIRRAELLPGHPVAGLGQHGDGQSPLGMAGLDLGRQALQRQDLAHRDGMDPEKRPVRRAGRKPAPEPLGEAEGLAALEAELDGVGGKEDRQGQQQKERIQGVHGPSTIPESRRPRQAE